MRILRIRAHDFGKLNGALDLAPGMTVVHGGNEAGKSTWLQAIFAGLCGRRRGRGANTLEEREFERQHEPWNGQPWRATIKFQLDDGRRIEIQQTDLKTKESSAHDAETGRPLGDEIIYRGSIDGSRFLGLNRQVVPSTLVIGQGDIQRLRQKSEKKGDEASALKEELQRAAASAGGAATAAEALRILKNYASNEIGTERRNSTKPLQRAIERATLAAEALEAARSHQLERNRLEDDLSDARERARRAENLVESCKRIQTQREFDRLDGRLAAIDRLQSRFPDGKPPAGPGEGRDSAVEQELREAAFEYRRRPDAPEELAGPSADEMEQQLTAMPESADGDREMAPEVAVAASRWRRASEGRAVREQLGPGDPPDPLIAKADEALAKRALAILELPPLEPIDEAERRVRELREERQQHMSQLVAHSGAYRWLGLGAGAGGLLGLLASFDVLPRLVGAAGWLLFVLCFLLLYRVQRRAPRSSFSEKAQPGFDMADATADLREQRRRHRQRQKQLEATRQALSGLGLEANADAVQAALATLKDREAWDREQSAWLRRTAAAREAEVEAETALRAALDGRGADDPEAPTASLLDQYEQSCLQNAGLAAVTDRREALIARIKARRHAQDMAASQLKRRTEAEARLQAALAAAGFPDGSTEAPEQWAARWLQEREQQVNRQRSDWSRLQHLLDGRDRQTLAAEREAVAARLGPVSSDDEPTELLALKGIELERKLEETRIQAGNARSEVSNYQGDLAKDAHLPSLAELEEEHSAADREVALLRRAGKIVDTAQQHLKEAQDEVYRMLAPDLRQGLEERLSRVTAGRYSRARVDPEQGLEVQLEVEDDDYRSASELSYGTLDQVYLLLRIALAEALGDKKESAPLFLDDATVHCDTDRTIRFLDLLLTLSEERQIVVFSQEEEVRAWAEGRLVGDARHRLIELDRNGRPTLPGEAGEPAARAGEDTPSPAPEQQKSLL